MMKRMQKYTGWLVLLVLMTAVAVTACGAPAGNSSAPEQSDNSAEEAVPLLGSFTAVDLDGNEVDQGILADYDLTMINIWATFCGPCLSEMPDLGELNAEYSEEGLRIVGLVTDVYDEDDLATAEEIIEKTGADYLHLLPSQDLMDTVLKDVTAVPTTVFVDSEGNVVGKPYLGARSKADWAAIIDKALAEVQG